MADQIEDQPLCCGWFGRLVRPVTPLLVWALAALLIAQVIFRYGLNHSLYWSEEAARYLLILLTFSASLALVASDRLTSFGGTNDRKRPVFVRFLDRCPALLFFFLLTLSTLQLIEKTQGQSSIALRLPMWLVYSPMLFFGLVGVALTLRAIVTKLRQRDDVD